MEAAPADRLDWMEALANHVGFSPSLTPPTGRDPLGSRLSVVGRERDEDGGAAEAGVLMRGWRIYAWTGVVIDCAMTQIGPVLRIHRYSKFKP